MSGGGSDGFSVMAIGGAQALGGAVEALSAAGIAVMEAPTSTEALDSIYIAPPQCILMPYPPPTTPAGIDLLTIIKRDHVYGHLPVILVFSDAAQALDVDWNKTPGDDFVIATLAPALASRVRLCVARIRRELNANPLTGLPGNIAIMMEAETRLATGRHFAMGYIDIDNFKPFNDKYGFSRGDEVLRMAGRILANAIHALDDSEAFAGHVGGDDFIFLCATANSERACIDILRSFDLLVPNFYDEEDRVRGEIQSVDRKGQAQAFPLMSCSIAVVDTAASSIAHAGDISARAAEVKKLAKKLPGSNYVIDRRA